MDCYQLIKSLLVLLFQPLVQFRVQNLKQRNVNTFKQENYLNPPHPNALSRKGSQAQIPWIIHYQITAKKNMAIKKNKQGGPAMREKINRDNFHWHERITQGSFGGRPEEY